jgi:transposase
VGTILDSSVKTGSRKGRLNYQVEFKRQLAVAACVPGVSVARIALAHGINANMLHKWCRQHRAGLFGPIEQEQVFLPVAISDTPPAVAAPAMPGRIEITYAGAVIRIDGCADATTVRAVLQGLHP